MTSQNFAPIWLPHWPAWMWTISRIFKFWQSKKFPRNIKLNSNMLRNFQSSV
eukprot:XP_001707387.1 Hypothetical protein GL50803_39642 [Giardia lamblia ATCC 50803]